MIRNISFKPFTYPNPLPSYSRWQGLEIYTLKGVVPGGYEILLGVLTVGKSQSGANTLSHALFESYDDHGRKMCEVRMRAGGYEREFMAVTGAMAEAGIEFEAINPSSKTEDLMNDLGEFFKKANPEIQEVRLILEER